MFVKLVMLNGQHVLVNPVHVAAIGMDGDGDTIILVNGKEMTLNGSMQEVLTALDDAGDRLDRFETIAAESEGVAGYHLNGEIAKWEEFGL